MGLEHYTRRRQMENEFALFQEHASKATDQ
jgi:hypothetical protein